jgi:hypothetical protein
MTISVPDGLIDKYKEACNFFINNNIIGRVCTVVYPPKRTVCANCTIKPVGTTSTSVYRHGGPAPFTFGRCPLCNGNGYTETEYTDTIRLRIYWNRSEWIKVGGVNFDDADVMVIGFMSDMPKINQSIEILLAKDQTEAVYRSKIIGKPYPHGFGRDTYFMAYLHGV